MDEQNQAAQTVVETETTQGESPSLEAPVTEQTTQSEEVSSVESGMTDEQRKAFQEQRIELKQLREEKAVRAKQESAFQVFRPQPVQVDPNQFVDSQGNTNWQAYNQAQVAQAKYEAQQAARDEIDEFKAREKYPDLFTNPRTEKLIAAQWLYERMNGTKASVYEIAESFNKDFSRSVAKAEKAGAEKMLTQVSEKEQAAVAPSQTSAAARQQLNADEMESLRRQSRGRGTESDMAVAERLKRMNGK